ncbi:hypothetical protein SAMN04488546_3245 [Geodermatophilus poikilotrophus]|uniref:Uncharacterized protein n=1 Tax=Geodermatophilus poikilotrophus TaxID=1333667 RepID=A0A1I0GEZ1_9ACTN|nr:hypothetical protein SAMN04488546_3245 [Geodermatophilus poikilotrophus]
MGGEGALLQSSTASTTSVDLTGTTTAEPGDSPRSSTASSVTDAVFS